MKGLESGHRLVLLLTGPREEIQEGSGRGLYYEWRGKKDFGDEPISRAQDE
jgi:hypothetical protein